MSIGYDRATKTFTLETLHTSYQMQVSSIGHLRHLYYGRRTAGDRLDHMLIPYDCGFSPNAPEARLRRDVSMDIQPQEYSAQDSGDFRLSALECQAQDTGAYGADLRYVEHEVREGKYALEGLPASFASEGEAVTLRVTLADAASGLRVELLYGVFEQADVITRAARIVNAGEKAVALEKAASLTLDLPFGKWDLLHFHGRHTMERQPQRVPVMDGIQTVSSRRGASSHHHNPFVILCDREATEDAGECCGVMLAYSGSYRIDVERDQTGLVRLVGGIHDEQFRWTLAPGEAFTTPEAILAFTADGLTALSHLYHGFLLSHVIPQRWARARRPVLINNWEATYFDFDAEKLVSIAAQAAELGAELFVLDDGWFGERNDDNAGLGDWIVNERKLPGGLNPLIARIHALGMKFGIWVEPEMVNEDSALYRAHPDWALTTPDRGPAYCRNQLVLDMSRPEVVQYLYGAMSALLREHDIAYIKWDMNRNLTDVYSRALPPERQGEVFHRYVLGVYALLDRLTREFPDVLFEGCAGGGGRFDAGMLHYCPQIWLSDNTDALDRLSIQHGTSFGYPTSAMGAHVSVCPNHQTGRSMPLGTRALVAMSGAFGYELDLRKLTDEERGEVREQIARYKALSSVIHGGKLYRLNAPCEDDCAAWMTVAADGERAILNLVVTRARSNHYGVHLRLKGLDPDAAYRIEDVRFFGCGAKLRSIHMDDAEMKARTYSGSALMYAGFTLPPMRGDYPSAQLLLARV